MFQFITFFLSIWMSCWSDSEVPLTNKLSPFLFLLFILQSFPIQTTLITFFSLSQLLREPPLLQIQPILFSLASIVYLKGMQVLELEADLWSKGARLPSTPNLPKTRLTKNSASSGMDGDFISYKNSSSEPHRKWEVAWNALTQENMSWIKHQ